MEFLTHADRCTVQQSNSSKTVEAEVLDFKEKDKLLVVLNKSVKLSLKWNGRLYEGRMAGLDFTSSGPKITRTIQGR
jgi:hypothetical protein